MFCLKKQVYVFIYAYFACFCAEMIFFDGVFTEVNCQNKVIFMVILVLSIKIML